MAPMASKYAELGVEHLRHLRVGHVEAVGVGSTEHEGDALVVLDHHRSPARRLVTPDGHAPVTQVLEMPAQQATGRRRTRAGR